MDCKLEEEIWKKNLKCKVSAVKIFVHVVVYINPADNLYRFKYEIFHSFTYTHNFHCKNFQLQ
jgi:hypothetical protein